MNDHDDYDYPWWLQFLANLVGSTIGVLIVLIIWQWWH